MPDAERPEVKGETAFYTPQECIGRAVQTFVSGLTAREQEQARSSLEIEARQALLSNSENRNSFR
jgi:hypothetical protein